MLDDASYQYFMELYIIDLIPLNYIKYTHISLLLCVSVKFKAIISEKISMPSKYQISKTILGPSQKKSYKLDVGIELIKDLFVKQNILQSKEPYKLSPNIFINSRFNQEYCHNCIEIYVYQNYIKNLFATKPIDQLNTCYQIILNMWKQDILPFIDQFYHDPIISDSEPVIKYENMNDFATREIMNKILKFRILDYRARQNITNLKYNRSNFHFNHIQNINKNIEQINVYVNKSITLFNEILSNTMDNAINNGYFLSKIDNKIQHIYKPTDLQKLFHIFIFIKPENLLRESFYKIKNISKKTSKNIPEIMANSFLNDVINNSVSVIHQFLYRLKEAICNSQSDWTKDSNPIRIVEFSDFIFNNININNQERSNL